MITMIGWVGGQTDEYVTQRAKTINLLMFKIICDSKISLLKECGVWRCVYSVRTFILGITHTHI